MKQVISLLGSGLLFTGAVVAVLAGPYSYRVAPLLASAIVLLALVTMLLALTGNSEWSPVPGTLLVLVMTMPLVGLTLGKGFPAPLPDVDLRSWVPLYIGFGLLAISGRSFGEGIPRKGQRTRVGSGQGILFELYELCATTSAVLLVCRLIASW